MDAFGTINLHMQTSPIQYIYQLAVLSLEDVHYTRYSTDAFFWYESLDCYYCTVSTLLEYPTVCTVLLCT